MMGVGSLEKAIYSTVAYRDMFKFPVTLEEIHRYLHGVRCTRSDLLAALSSSPFLETHLDSDGEFFCLKGRGEIFAIRRARRALSLAQEPTAHLFARFLAMLPNVRMVAMTGSLAAGNFPEDGDIDFLLVTDSGTLWRTRALCRMLALLDERLRRGLFCPNTFLSAAALSLTRRTLYDAQELCQMIPLHGLDVYRTVRRANEWTAGWLPNADGPPPGHADLTPLSDGLKRAGEWLLASAAGRALEDFEARRKIRRFNESEHLKGAWTRSTPESHSMWDGMRLRIEQAWTDRMNEIADLEA
jgi:predicted nucleotidyltransferase